MQFHARPPSFLVLIQRGLFVHDELTGRNSSSTVGARPQDTLSCRRLFERRQIIPAPASGLSVFAKIVQPFLSPVLKSRRFFLFSLVPNEFRRQWWADSCFEKSARP